MKSNIGSLARRAAQEAKQALELADRIDLINPELGLEVRHRRVAEALADRRPLTVRIRRSAGPR
jgi:hypothetical protein